RIWISRITLNKCRDWARRRAVRRFFAFAQPLEAAETLADAGPTPEAAALSQAELARINDAIAALPATLKDVLVLRTIEALSQADVAQILRISEKAVETRLYRARQKLTDLLRDADAPRV
ncbi:MAG: sigma-70 family RNA polymerase sigma factor, partial [bacterium]|nr:sigma-70 family RNA polymerase sigma factor [bacterium]